MSDLKLTAESDASRVDVADWVLRSGTALAFFLFGSEKFSATSPWITLFDAIGLGQWFRYFTGTLQLLGASLILVPRTAIAGATLLACTMVGAIVVHVFVRKDPFASLMPIVLLVLILAAALRHRSRRA